jgi:predicted ATPase with chaperone activity
MTQLNLSVRAYHRTQSVKLARTIADPAGSEEIQSMHLAEASVKHALEGGARKCRSWPKLTM